MGAEGEDVAATPNGKERHRRVGYGVVARQSSEAREYAEPGPRVFLSQRYSRADLSRDDRGPSLNGWVHEGTLQVRCVGAREISREDRAGIARERRPNRE